MLYPLCWRRFVGRRPSSGTVLAVAVTLVLAFAWPSTVQAQAQADSLSRQRALYAEAKKYVGKPKYLQRFRQLKSRLVDYPLYPYLQYQDLIGRLSVGQQADIDHFLRSYDSTPLAGRLRDKWLDYLRQQDAWEQYLRYYRVGAANNLELACYYQYARYLNSPGADALNAGIELWRIPKTAPAGCDSLFAILVNNGLISQELAWQRYLGALVNRDHELARELEQGFGSPTYQALAKNYAALARDPRLLANFATFADQTPDTLLVIEQALRDLARTDAVTAMGHWSHYRQANQFAVASQQQVIASLVRGLYEQGKPRIALKYLEGNIDLAPADLLEWRLRLALKDGDWAGIARWIGNIPPEIRHEPLWRYWRARIVLMTTQDSIAQEAAQNTYRELARERNFYGFLASDWADSPYQMLAPPRPITAAEIDRLARSAAMVRVKELIYFNDWVAASQEWHFALQGRSQHEARVAAHLAQRWGWYQQAIVTMAKANFLDDLEVRFPRPFATHFQHNAKAQAVPPNLLFALARQESAFNPSIASSAGARGLMQLMPATAAEVARAKGIRLRGKSDLDNPAINVRLGSTYYRQMLDRFANNRILATAAYNAGPGRVRGWLEETNGRLPFDVWIETIPFKETRNYVQNVLAYSVIYNHHLHGARRMLDAHEKAATL